MLIEILLVATSLVGIVLFIALRWKQNKGIGVRAIQFVAIILLVPTAALLALRGVLGAEATATLFGAIAGYVLATIGLKDASE